MLPRAPFAGGGRKANLPTGRMTLPRAAEIVVFRALHVGLGAPKSHPNRRLCSMLRTDGRVLWSRMAAECVRTDGHAVPSRIPLDCTFQTGSRTP